MISENFYDYYGLRPPFASYPIEAFVESGRNITFVAMNQEEYDYLQGMQYLVGSKLTIVLFQNFHDQAYEYRKLVPLDQLMKGIACSYSGLHYLMMSPHGDLKWKQIEKQRNTRPVKFGDFI